MKRAKKIAICAVIACVLVIGGAAAYYTPATYVSLDVNPSIEYSVNIFGRVISVRGSNDDGTEIVSGITLKNLKNKTIEDAISITVDEIAQNGYLDGEGAGIVIATSAQNSKKPGKLAQSLENAANEACAKNNRTAVVNAEAVGKEVVKEARELGVTPGKLQLVEKMMVSEGNAGNLNKDEWLQRPVRDIMAEMEQNTEQENNAGEETKNQEQNYNFETNGSMTGSMGSGIASEPPANGSGSGSGAAGSGAATEPINSGSGLAGSGAGSTSGGGASEPPNIDAGSGTSFGNGQGMSGASGTEPPSNGSGASGGSGGRN